MAETESPVQAYQLHALLRGIKPPIWRRLLVRGDSSVADLHHTLQIAVRWSDCHLHRCLIRGKEYGISRADSTSFTTDPKRVDLADFGFRPRERFLYEYDFSDLWQHQVRFEATRPVEAGNIYPVCVGGARAAPPEDCGGPSAYMELLDRHQLNWPHAELFLIAETMSRLLGAKEDENICTRLGVALPFTKIFTPSITKMSDMIS